MFKWHTFIYVLVVQESSKDTGEYTHLTCRQRRFMIVHYNYQFTIKHLLTLEIQIQDQ